jgi:hypothetical protein
VAVHVVNRGALPAEATIDLGGVIPLGPLEISTVSGPSLATANTAAAPDAVTTHVRSLDSVPMADGLVRHTFEPWSVTGLVLSI